MGKAPAAKICTRCKCEKPIEQFSFKGSGQRKSQCKPCVATADSSYRKKSTVYYARLERLRAATLAKREALGLGPRRLTNAESPQAARKAYNARNIHKRNAWRKLGNAIRKGRIKPWPVCALPTCSGAPEAHHPDYSRPYDVVWLCRDHHLQIHHEARYGS